MTEIDIINGTGIAIVSSYLTVAIVSETTPKINKYGEEEYSLAGYILLASATLIKLPIKLFLEINEKVEEDVREMKSVEDVPEVTKSVSEKANDHELIV